MMTPQQIEELFAPLLAKHFSSEAARARFAEHMREDGHELEGK